MIGGSALPSSDRNSAVSTRVLSPRCRRATRSLAGVVVAALSLLGIAEPAVATMWPTSVAQAGGLTPERASSVSAACSTATARTLIDQHHLNGFLLPPAQVLCGPFTGPRSEAMAVAIAAGTCWPVQGWAVFSFSGGTWKLGLYEGAFIVPPLVAVGTDIKETRPVFRSTGSRCDPTGGTEARLWHWDGTAMVSGPWHQVTPGLTTGVLRADACTSPTSCMAVGYGYSKTGNTVPLAERWDGTTWAAEKTPTLAGASSLDAVSCSSVRACMALVSYQTPTSEDLPLAEEWDGSAWGAHNIPALPAASSLSGVSCSSPDACIAVGAANTAAYPVALVVAWDGSTWAVQKTPLLTSTSSLDAVSCSSAKACTAVGSQYIGGVEAPLAERWDGTTWAAQKTPNLFGSGVESGLTGVSCSPSSCTAVGSEHSRLDDEAVGPVAEAWEGTTWAAQKIPDPVGELSAVSCSSARCTAVGPLHVYGNGDLVERWDGTTWVAQNTPDPSDDILYGVSCSSAKACTAVGSQGFGVTAVTLAEAWTGTTWVVEQGLSPNG
jgi:hypothetical protein